MTLLALAAGLSAICLALHERWSTRCLLIPSPASSTASTAGSPASSGAMRFGAELDLLSDFLCFGVAPGFTLDPWSLQDAGRIGWALVLLLCICCALRLARFNTDLEEEERPLWARNFFTGAPSPAGAGLALCPMLLSFQIDAGFVRHPAFVGFFVLATSLLLVSRVRTFTFKKVHRPSLGLAGHVGVGLYLALLFSTP